MFVLPGEVVVRSARDGAVIARVAIDDEADPNASLELSPDGARLAIADETSVRVVTLADGEEALVDAAAWTGFLPDTLRAEGSSGAGRALRRIADGREVARLALDGACVVACDASAARAAVARDREITLYDSELRVVERFEAPLAVTALALSRDGTRVAAAGRGAVVMGFDARR